MCNKILSRRESQRLYTKKPLWIAEGPATAHIAILKNISGIILLVSIQMCGMPSISKADPTIQVPPAATKGETTACAAIGTRIARAIGGTLNNTGDATGSDAYIDLLRPSMSIVIRCPEGKFVTVKDYDERSARPLVLSVAVKALATVIPSEYWNNNLPMRCISSAVRANRSPVKKMGRAHARELALIPYFEGDLTLGHDIDFACSYDAKENLQFFVEIP